MLLIAVAERPLLLLSDVVLWCVAGVFREANPDAGRGPYTGVAKAADGGEAAIGGYDGYAPLVAQAIEAFKTGVVPVSSDETVEILAFMEAVSRQLTLEHRTLLCFMLLLLLFVLLLMLSLSFLPSVPCVSSV